MDSSSVEIATSRGIRVGADKTEEGARVSGPEQRKDGWLKGRLRARWRCRREVVASWGRQSLRK